MDNKNQSAFPVSQPIPENWDNLAGGLTKRELIAAMIMQGYLSSGRKFTVVSAKETSLEDASVMAADALLARLEKLE